MNGCINRGMAKIFKSTQKHTEYKKGANYLLCNMKKSVEQISFLTPLLSRKIFMLLFTRARECISFSLREFHSILQ
jgi:hypothetical protein